MGLGPDVARLVIERGAAAVVAALMSHCATPQDLAFAFATIMSAASDARIGEQLHFLLGDTANLKDLELTGENLSKQVTQRRIAVLSDPIALLTGVPMQPAHVLVAVSAVVTFGALKRHLLVDQASVADFASLLSRQLPLIAPFLTESIANCLGFESVSRFSEMTGQRLAIQKQAPVAPPVYGKVNVPVSTAVRYGTIPEAVLAPRLAPAGLASNPASHLSVGIARGQRRRRRSQYWLACVLILLALVAISASAMLAYEETHPGFMRSTVMSLGVNVLDRTRVRAVTSVASTPKPDTGSQRPIASGHAQ